MMVYLFANPRDHEGPDLVSVCSTRHVAVRLLREMLDGTESQHRGCSSIPGFAEAEPLEQAITEFLTGSYSELGVYDEDQFTVAWIQEREVILRGIGDPR